MLRPKVPCILRCHRVIHRVAPFEVAVDGQPVQRLDQLLRRLSAELPDALRPLPSVALHQARKVFVRLLHQQRRAGRGAPASDAPSLDERHPHSGLRKAPRDGGAGDAATHDGDIDGEIPTENGKPRALSARCGFQPERDVDSQTRHTVDRSLAPRLLPVNVA
jgi:hypothetical protein